ncbi:MAG: hypothetical protein ACFNVH_01330, partial [Segatella maculosa]
LRWQPKKLLQQNKLTISIKRYKESAVIDVTALFYLWQLGLTPYQLLIQRALLSRVKWVR